MIKAIVEVVEGSHYIRINLTGKTKKDRDALAVIRDSRQSYWVKLSLQPQPKVEGVETVILCTD